MGRGKRDFFREILNFICNGVVAKGKVQLCAVGSIPQPVDNPLDAIPFCVSSTLPQNVLCLPGWMIPSFIKPSTIKLGVH